MKNLKVGIFLGIRQVQRASLWANSLIITVIVFTFLNLIILSGILSGLVDGAVKEVRVQSTGDIIIKPLEQEIRILETERFVSELKEYPEIASFSVRYIGSAKIEANYKDRRDLTTEPDVIVTNITGIDPASENNTSGIASLIQEGEYLDPNESGYILIGKENIDRYAAEYGGVFESLEGIYPGDTVLVSVGDQTREFIVKGIIDSKVEIISFGVYMPEREFRRLFERADYNGDQIAVRLNPGESATRLTEQLHENDLSRLAQIKTSEEDIPKFITDIRKTFDVLGIFIGAVSVIVASITIFIIIFINALSRRRQIGILKAIGITHEAIEYAYVTQAAFYSVLGSGLGIILMATFIVPYFEQNPIDFPFSDVSLSVTNSDLFGRAGTLVLITLIAGFIPAWMITRQDTLSAILGRK